MLVVADNRCLDPKIRLALYLPTVVRLSMRSWRQFPSSRTTSTPHVPTATYSCTRERPDAFEARTIS
jgi:hypothetical protein